MSLIHLDKSVLTFHLKEIMEDGHLGDHLVLLGLGIVLLSPKLLPSLVRTSRPLTKRVIKHGLSISAKSSPMTLSEWIAEAQRQQFATQTRTKQFSSR